MTSPIPRRGDPAVTELVRSLATASERQLLRIVAAVDGMSARGVADDLIAPIRHRLVSLHPARPLRFARLVFLPLDRLIVPASDWRPTHALIPRTAIVPLAQVVEAGLGAELAAIKRAIHNRRTDQAGVVAALGATLWPRAGSILAGSGGPGDRDMTGLDEPAYRELAHCIAAVLSAAPALDRICAETIPALALPDPAAFRAMVRQVSGSAPDALPMLVALLMLRLPQAVHLLYNSRSDGSAAGLRAATDQAADLILEQLEHAGSPLAATPLTGAAAAVGRIAMLLDQLHRDHVSIERRKQLHGLRRKLDAHFKARFEAGLDSGLLAALGELPDVPDARQISRLETTARGLRALEWEARRFGSGDSYDRSLARAAETVLGRNSGIGFADRLRLIEILAGSEAALKILEWRGSAA